MFQQTRVLTTHADAVRYVTLLGVGCVAALPVVCIMMWQRELSPAELVVDDYTSMLYKVLDPSFP